MAHEAKVEEHKDGEVVKYSATCWCGWKADEERDDKRAAEDDAAMHMMLNEEF